MKTDIFQEESAEFKATIALNKKKKKKHQGYLSAYVDNLDFFYLRQTYNYGEHEGKKR
jgi:hypothetical protein